ncbi:DUF4097 family beta strand repeat protein [Streptomyces sp. TRM66268-LWL]|uniref:DUF4097 family beta strand repeat protein n=1 Tax=Streptomyces polyasparticus TaxID=2767826 RepID=A0ABR7S713_9ACTN|nr:DUF4097 family beta strand repeat-containing protein [Streptomyces polyasparticus]MBC9711270.1 DUF4097 family beta strand repeat protein [Streptomyces polyasparticus]
MPESTWTVAEPQKLTFDDPVTTLQVRIVNGTVNVVGTDEATARLEITEVHGPELLVGHEDGVLTVGYDDLPWKGWLKFLDRKGWQRRAVVSLAVPTGTRVEVGVVGASAMVSGIDGATTVKGVTGDCALVGLSGPVRAESVSGDVEAQSVTGELRFNSVSGNLTVVDAGTSVRADSVSGDMIVDLDPADRATDVALNSVSGEIAIRLPHPADAEVEANTTSGAVSNAFEDLRVSGQWGAKRITGRLGAGRGKLKATTISGAIALLRRPARDGFDDAPPADAPLTDTPPTAPSADAPTTHTPAADAPATDAPPSDAPPSPEGPNGKVL